MITPKILYKYSKEDTINITFSQTSSRIIDTKLEKEVDLLWDKQVSLCNEKSEKIWDGLSYRLNSYSINSKQFSLELGPIHWSKRSALRYIDEIHQLGENYWGKGIFVTTLLCTHDNKYIFGKRKKTTSERSIMTTIGGLVSPEEIEVQTFEDFHKMLHLEIHEETGIPPEHIISEDFLGSVYSSRTDVGFVFLTKLDLSSHEIEDIFSKREDDELASFYFVEASSLKNHLTDMGNYWALLPLLLEYK